MSLSLSARLRAPLLVSSAALVGLAIAPVAASADAWSFTTVGAKPAAACTNPAVWKAFAKFGDTADYALAPGGSFEIGGAGWKLENAKIVTGNDTTGVGAGSRSILLGVSKYGGAAEATSPEFCVTQDHPTFRAVVRSVGASWQSGFGSNILYRTTGDLSKNYLDLVGTQHASRSWVPTAINPLATAIPDSAFAGGVLVRIKYYLPSYNVKDGGSIQIDNVMVDPSRRS